MKQAILITAYKNFAHLVDIIDFFDDSFYIYIHIDKKSKIPQKIYKELQTNVYVKMVSQKFVVNWGGLNHLKSILFLGGAALKNKDIQYFHLISGQDFPIKNIIQFKKMIDDSKAKGFLEYFEIPTKGWGNENGGLDRVTYYHLYDVLNAKKHIKWMWKFVNLQKKLHVKRSITNKTPKLYGGSTWWSLSRGVLQYVVDYTSKKPYLFNRLKYTFCPEEIYFQTVIINSAFSKQIINNNLRYIDWNPDRVGKHNPSPAILNLSDFEKISTSDKLFARKFEKPTSDILKAAVQKSINCR
ncbi:beta-1,6-N-acetylglucosaminyltransferase [Sabulilitoribacter arenilitoris]|uniref:Peptide O-xylosyltransferase n=1 Tax=Wocania arenilitoris TaxID=2044858 RepID=A0AAE3JNV9_9FLAO|nr:beta-1,6-N-acetylglucosaminyltransferase [Wocania arenilitoris]MCF7569076.1 beta-1,6-N-acetylglucosaminyltransferase [Wocania arenilitoris]